MKRWLVMISEFIERNSKDLHLFCAFLTVIIPIILYYKDSFGIYEDSPLFACVMVLLVLSNMYLGKTQVSTALNHNSEKERVNSLYPPKKEK